MNPGDQLLYVLSAKRTMSWADFKSTADTLLFGELTGTADWQFVRHRILRMIACLGHCHFTFGDNSGTIYAAPPSLIRLPTNGKVAAILTGSRSPESFEKLVRIGEKHSNVVVDTKDQKGRFGTTIPSRIYVTGPTETEIASFAAEVSVFFEETPPAWKFLHCGADLDSYLSSLVWTEGPELNWRRKDFDPEYCRFRDGSTTGGFLRLSRYSDPIRNIFRYRLWKQNVWASVDLDWGRYVVLREQGFDTLFYDRKHHIMLIPSTAPLPSLLERALGLCTGLAPFFLSSGKQSSTARTYDAFKGIPQSIATLICERVGQELAYCNLESSFSESMWRE
jgi:hypothetical protein